MKQSLILIIICAIAQFTLAKGVSPWMPLSQSRVLDRDIEKFVAIVGITKLKKPYSLALIQSKLPRIQKSHPGLYKRLHTALLQYKHTGSVTHLGLKAYDSKTDNDEASRSGQKTHYLPNSQGLTTEDSVRINFSGIWQPSVWYGFYGGFVATDNDFNPSGTTIALGTDWAQLDIGYKEHWWSPFQGSAKLLSSHAQTMPSIALENSMPIELFGLGFDYEILLAQMSTQPTSYDGEHSNTNNPYIAAMHLSFSPLEWWSIGVNRVLQFSGGERPFGLKTLVRAFIDPRGTDNDADVDNESGNQIASIQSKMNFEHFVISAELAGEDTLNNKDWQLGNTAITAGLFIPTFFSESLSFTYEYSEWQKAWYTNNVYGYGYVHEGFVVGDWHLQDQHNIAGGQPGRSHYLNVVFQHQGGNSLDLQVSEYKTDNFGGGLDADGWYAKLEYQHALKLGQLSAALAGGQTLEENDYLQFSLGWQWK